jgi:hypothetical protein
MTGQGSYDRDKLREILGTMPVFIAAVVFLAWLVSLMLKLFRHLSAVG